MYVVNAQEGGACLQVKEVEAEEEEAEADAEAEAEADLKSEGDDGVEPDPEVSSAQSI